jgi:alpha-beta hydrolase superfamily lysophospholipase
MTVATPTSRSVPECVLLSDGRGGAVELFVAARSSDDRSSATAGLRASSEPHRRFDTRAPALLIVHGHQFPERPGGRGRLTSDMIEHWCGRGWILAAVSQPGYGESTGPADFCGPRTQATLRIAIDHLLERNADPAGTIVWAISRGAVAAACAFVDDATEPALLILQAGVYDMEHWVDWVRDGAPGGDAQVARAILANQEREAGLDRDALRARSGVLHAARGSCDVLLVHGRSDPQGPPDDWQRMVDALRRAGRRVETAIAPEGGHSLPPQVAMNALALYWPELAK